MDDDQRFTEIFRSFHAHVLAYARRRVAQHVANDVVADTFLAAWRHLDRLPPDPLPWLYRAASFEIAKHYRQSRRETRLRPLADLGESTATESDFAGQVVWSDRWRTAFAFLSPNDREVLRLVAWEGLDPAQAASVLGCSIVAFKVRLHRARRRLTTLVATEDLAPSGPAPTKQPPNEEPTVRAIASPIALFSTPSSADALRTRSDDAARRPDPEEGCS